MAKVLVLALSSFKGLDNKSGKYSVQFLSVLKDVH